jgi:hypothetical protein
MAMFARRASPLGLLLTVVALIAQLAFGAAVPAVPLVLDTPICHAADAGDAPAPANPQHAPGCLLCSLCPTPGTIAALPAPPPSLPTARAVVVADAAHDLPPTEPVAATPPWRPGSPRAPPSTQA